MSTRRSPKIYFRTRGGPTQGWGNIFRLSTFASYCRERGCPDITFFVEGPQEVHDYLGTQRLRVVPIPEDIGLSDESEIFAKAPCADVLIIEMLDCNYQRQSHLRKFTDKLVVFDDLLDHGYCADLVVCGQPLPSYGNRCISDSRTEFLLGLDYFLSRPEFLHRYETHRLYKRVPETLLVTLGGGRYNVAHLKIAHALAEYRMPCHPTFILGYAQQDVLKNELQTLLPQAKIIGGTNHMEEMLWETDLAIVSGGYSKCEAAMTGTPAIMIAVQWHQIPLAEEFFNISGMPYLGYMSFMTPSEIHRQIEKLTPQKERQALGHQLHSVIDGNGFDRVFAAIFSK